MNKLPRLPRLPGSDTRQVQLVVDTCLVRHITSHIELPSDIQASYPNVKIETRLNLALLFRVVFCSADISRASEVLARLASQVDSCQVSSIVTKRLKVEED